ncbi:hypothetical protein CONCODRAFT_80304 [Conidiobolus coronatus NRRL 28638]|uniref:F-box domain-containing protein n=1 Tax=Conidiobolus coronatus (strain ATCC 28846 / CBS 209.66 / NRRL 28638) TaxID=796925 RepID=A0A137NWI1_CONC2|nr:hypothetical protein CONCODRAFT_80304 [Conidiobolus coronatus NRRL 28638]|eukprot:KXN67011.1 hypothetical protein CONCODRAFT_80304 [Conidiobolus coronatus NRRL 28638]
MYNNEAYDNVLINNNSDIEWGSLPLITTITNYLYKHDLIELSLACHYFRNKLNSKIFHSLTLFKSENFNNFKIKRPRLSALELKTEMISSIVRDLDKKVLLVKEIRFNHRINPSIADIVQSSFINCTTLIIKTKYYIKLTTLLKLTRLKLKFIYLEGISGRVQTLLSYYKAIFPLKIKCISYHWYYLNENLRSILTTVNFNTYKHLEGWKITGRFDFNRFLKPQPTIKELCLINIPIIDNDKLRLMFNNNTQLEYMSFHSTHPNFEIIQSIINLPNLKKLQIYFTSRSIDGDDTIPQSYKLNNSKTIKHLLLAYEASQFLIETLLNSLPNLTKLTLSSELIDQVVGINWRLYDNLEVVYLAPKNDKTIEIKRIINSELLRTRVLFKEPFFTSGLELLI